MLIRKSTEYNMQIYIKMCLFRLLCKNYIKVKCVCVHEAGEEERHGERWGIDWVHACSVCSVMSDSSPQVSLSIGFSKERIRGEVYHFLIQEIFPIRSNPHSYPHSYEWILYCWAIGETKCTTNCLGLKSDDGGSGPRCSHK